MTSTDLHQGVIEQTAVRDTPVVCVIYNRPALVRQLVSKLRVIKPRHLLIVADGPRADSDSDALACQQARDEFDRVDWPCDIDRLFARTNLGCSPRVRSGLDWAFSRVDRAIVLEDDIDPDPRFFAWATQMLDVYQHRDDVAMLTGHNPLVHWPGTMKGSFGVPSRRGGIWGWATWGCRWRAVWQTAIDGPVCMAAHDIASLHFEPSVSELYTYYLEQARQPDGLAWDCDWSLRMAMSGKLAVVSPVNLIRNRGLGPEATHTKADDDLLFRLPRPEESQRLAGEQLISPMNVEFLQHGGVDDTFDRARVLIELLVRTRDSRVARRLAVRSNLPLNRGVRLHLLPFAHIQETRRWLEHMAATGVDPMAIGRWQRALVSADCGETAPTAGGS